MARLSIAMALSTSLTVGACAAPRTQLGTVSQDQIIIEQARQQEFALQTQLKQTFRLQAVANPLLTAAVSLCGEKVRPVSGYMAANVHLWQKDFFRAAQRLGYNDTLTIIHVTPRLPADEAGLKVGDRILAVNGASIRTGARALSDLESKLPGAKERSPKAYRLTYGRGSETATVEIRTAMACAYTPRVDQSDIVNAGADGRSIIIPVGMLRFVADDDELAVVVGHELAHDAMRHIDAVNKNSMVGALLGAIVDVAAATQGVNTQGDFAKHGAEIGSMVFSQDFEREADYVGLYVLALAGRPIDVAPTFWRRMAAAKPNSIKFASSHPTTAERFVRLDTWRGEIDRKVALGLVLAPEMKKGNAASTGSFGAVPTKTALNPNANRSPSKGDEASQKLPRKTQQTQSEPANSTKSTLSVMANGRNEVVRSVRSSDRDERAALEKIPSSVAARAVIGAPSTESDRLAAIESFAEGEAFMGSHQWNKAEESFRKTVLSDGSVASYHAKLGSVLMLLGKWKDAEAEYIAAMMLDLDNLAYRRMVKEARSKR